MKSIKTGKINSNGLGPVILKYRKEGLSFPKIVKKIQELANITLDKETIARYVRYHKETEQELVQKDVELQKQVRDLALDYQGEIQSILQEVREVKGRALTKGDMATFDKMIGRLFQGLELINRIVDGGNVKQQNYDIKVVYQNIFNEADEKYKSLKNDILGFNTNIKNFIAEEDGKIAEELQSTVKDKIVDIEYENVLDIKRKQSESKSQ